MGHIFIKKRSRFLWQTRSTACCFRQGETKFCEVDANWRRKIRDFSFNWFYWKRQRMDWLNQGKFTKVRDQLIIYCWDYNKQNQCCSVLFQILIRQFSAGYRCHPRRTKNCAFTKDWRWLRLKISQSYDWWGSPFLYEGMGHTSKFR